MTTTIDRIKDEVKKELTAEEIAELQLVLKQAEDMEFYNSGYSHCCGGFAMVEAYEMDEDEDDEDDENWQDIIRVRVSLGLQEENHTRQDTWDGYFPRKALLNKDLDTLDRAKLIDLGC